MRCLSTAVSSIHFAVAFFAPETGFGDAASAGGSRRCQPALSMPTNNPPLLSLLSVNVAAQVSNVA